MYQCPNCGGRLIFDISSQSMLCEHCNTHYNPYKLGEGNSAEENKEYDVTVFKCPQCGGEIMSTDNTIADFCSFCGASTVLESRISKELRPGYIIPFSKTKQDCKNQYKKMMKRAWFAPKELKDEKYGEITFIRTTLVLTVIWTVSIREYRLMRHLHLMII